MTPSVGRIVHYVSFPVGAINGDKPIPSECWAAIVTYVHDAEAGVVDLTAFPPTSREAEPLAIDLAEREEIDDEGHTRDGKRPTPGKWHAPERVF